MNQLRDHCEEFARRAVRNNEQAMLYLNIMFNILQTWDDLIDRDVELDDKAINDAFWNALIALPYCAFYIQHKDTLTPLLSNFILQWNAATHLEKTKPTDEHSLHIAFILRSTYADLITHCALLIGGYVWAQEVSKELRIFNNEESFSEYKTEIEENYVLQQTEETDNT